MKKPKIKKPLNQAWLKLSNHWLDNFNNAIILLTKTQQQLIIAFLTKISLNLHWPGNDQKNAVKALKNLKLKANFTKIQQDTKLRITKHEIKKTLKIVKDNLTLNYEERDANGVLQKKIFNLSIFKQISFALIRQKGKLNKFIYYEIEPLFGKAFGTALTKTFSTLNIKNVLCVKSPKTIPLILLIKKIWTPFNQIITITAKTFIKHFQIEPKSIKMFIKDLKRRQILTEYNNTTQEPHKKIKGIQIKGEFIIFKFIR